MTVTVNPQTAEAAFLEQFPEYASTAALDALRAAEYRRLDDQRHVYLDYTGGSLYAESQIREHAALLTGGVFGNPHSVNLTSSATTAIVERTRQHVLQYFNAPPGAYTAIFTANATGALKHVGESFAFEAGSRYVLTYDNHNSVNGIREFALARGAQVEYVPLTAPDLRIDAAALEAALERADGSRPNLFAFPAQSNFSGVKHPLDLVARARAKGWHVLLDAAAFVPTNRLDLAEVQPDFVSLSFYKMFGYPTGVGCLLVRNEALPVLRRPWFAGGTVRFVTVQGRRHFLSPAEGGFEDGTLNYLSIAGVDIGLRHLEKVDVDTVQTRVRCLTAWLLSALFDLQHTNGRHMVRIYGPTTAAMRGGTITFNLYDPDGHLIDYRRVEELASAERISLRTGCFCNPGAGEIAEGLTEADMIAGTDLPDVSLARFVDLLQARAHKSAGAIRASLGIASNFADVHRLVGFVAGFRDQTRLALGQTEFDVDSCRVVRDTA